MPVDFNLVPGTGLSLASRGTALVCYIGTYKKDGSIVYGAEENQAPRIHGR